MSDYTESDIKDFEKIENTDNALILKELKRLREEVDKLNNKLPSSKTDQQKRDEIFAIKDPSKRLKAISENMDLFR